MKRCQQCAVLRDAMRVADRQRKKERDAQAREIERLRSALQEARSGLRGVEAKARDHVSWADDVLSSPVSSPEGPKR